MAHKKLFGNNRPKSCDVCEFGQLSADREVVLCSKKGVVPTFHHCRHFRYDPLRRVPQRPQALGTFSAEDFSLDSFDLDAFLDTAAPQQPVESDDAQDTPSASTDADTLARLKEILNSGEDVTIDDVMAILDTDASPAASAEADLILDETEDIFKDLERLTLEKVRGSAKAAFRDDSICLADELSEDEMRDYEQTTLGASSLQNGGVSSALSENEAFVVLGDAPLADEPLQAALEAESLVFLSAKPEEEDEPIPEDDTLPGLRIVDFRDSVPEEEDFLAPPTDLL